MERNGVDQYVSRILVMRCKVLKVTAGWCTSSWPNPRCLKTLATRTSRKCFAAALLLGGCQRRVCHTSQRSSAAQQQNQVPTGLRNLTFILIYYYFFESPESGRPKVFLKRPQTAVLGMMNFQKSFTENA